MGWLKLTEMHQLSSGDWKSEIKTLWGYASSETSRGILLCLF